MRVKLIYVGMMLAAAVVFAACNAVDNTATTKPNPVPGSNTVYPDGARRITTDELETMLKNGQAFVVDVRNQASYDLGHIPGAKLIPLGEILNHLSELPRDKTIVTYCS
jgi:3-mercaptopyruvate sulfurtransferase SseA